MTENCGTGCRDPKHMIQCLKCGVWYHYGTVHHCSITGHIYASDKVNYIDMEVKEDGSFSN
jgi:hypothetical protein